MCVHDIHIHRCVYVCKTSFKIKKLSFNSKTCTINVTDLNVKNKLGVSDDSIMLEGRQADRQMDRRTLFKPRQKQTAVRGKRSKILISSKLMFSPDVQR